MTQPNIHKGMWTGEGTKSKRPRLAIPFSQTEVYCEIIAGVILISSMVYLYAVWTKLPAQIPEHFNFQGEPDRWGSRNNIFALIGIMSGIYIMISILQRFPHIYNYPFGLTPENVQRQYLLARRLLTLVKTEVILLFSFILWGTVTIAQQHAHVMGIWVLLVPVILFGTIVHYYIQASRAR